MRSCLACAFQVGLRLRKRARGRHDRFVHFSRCDEMSVHLALGSAGLAARIWIRAAAAEANTTTPITNTRQTAIPVTPLVSLGETACRVVTLLQLREIA